MKAIVAAVVLVVTCVLAALASIERFSTPAVLVGDYEPGTQYPESWAPTSARERLSLAARTQTARYPSFVP